MKKGFTLIELLAVIVILAIIALIATPIILGIINDAREESNERSVELYASAVRNGIAAYQLRTGNEVLPGTYNKDNELPFEVEYDGKVECTNVIISSDGKVSLDKCTVNGGEKTYNYGIEEDETPEEETPDTGSTQVYKPQYYHFEIGFSGKVGTTVEPTNPSSVPPTERNFYLGYDVEGGKVSAAYLCFKIGENGIEYCLKPNDYAKSTEIMKEAFGESACSFNDDISYCDADGFSAYASSDGHVYAYGGDVGCDVNVDGSFVCGY